MDKLNSCSRSQFQQASIDVFNLFKQAKRSCTDAYNQGKEDAFEEIIKYVMCISSSCKYVPMNDFISYLQSRYDCHRFKCHTEVSANYS